MVFPKPSEKAILTIGGMEYSDWTTVMVKHSMREHPFIKFRFTCSEGTPLAKNFAALQIVPGMDCTVTLAGHPAADGKINTRQVFYDARRHHVELQGSSETMGLAQASVVHKTGEWKDVTYEKYAKELLKPFPGIRFLVEGGQLPTTKFPRISNTPGQSVLDALELPLRALGGIRLASNPKGDLVAIVGPNGSSDTVYEGDLGRPSILEGREVIFNPGMANGHYNIGQKPANNDEWGAKAAHVPFLGSQVPSFVSGYAPQITPLEMPAWTKDHLKGRGNLARDFMSEDEVTVYATVQGWERPSGGLWERNQTVTVVSPMLVMPSGTRLTCKSATFTQDDKTGTRTVLELVNEIALAGLIPQGPGGG
jgi:prophage tail gpP-like protein